MLLIMLISAYNNNQLAQRALDLFDEMRKTGTIKANNVTYMLYFQSCVQLKAFDQAKTLHEEFKEKNPNYVKNKVNQELKRFFFLSIELKLFFSGID